MKKNTKRYICFAAIALILLCVVLCEVFREQIFGEGVFSDRLYYITTRALGGLIFLILMLFESMLGLFKIKLRGSLKAVLFTLPCLAVAINNFPIISYFSGNAYINASASAVLLYAAECFSVGFFEEIAFRGVIFNSILSRNKRTPLGVFFAIVISSAIFGATHLLNLLAGASIGSVLLQISYSFLIGGMCAVVLIKTRCLWYCVLIHSVYNFCGGVVPELGGGVIWDTPTVVLTALLAVAVAVYVIVSLTKIQIKEIDLLLGEEKSRDI